MKRLIFGLIAIVMIAGCTTKPENTEDNALYAKQPCNYAVLIIEAKIKGADLAALHSELFWDPNKEPMEGVELSSLKDLFSPADELFPTGTIESREVSLPRPFIEQATIHKIRHLSDAEVYEYPVLYATPGEQAISDQTVSKEMLKDYKVVDGNTVKTMETVKLGHYAEILITRAEGSNANCDLKLGFRKLVGKEVYTLYNGDQVEMPFINSSEINTVTSLPDSEWAMFSSSVEAQTQNDMTTKSMRAFFICVMPCGSGIE